MSKREFNFETVRQICLGLPRAQESTAYGMPAFKIDGKLLVAVPANRSVEPNSLVVRVSFEDRAELLSESPKVYYITEHYRDYDAVLVRLSCVTSEALGGILRTAYNYVLKSLEVSLTKPDQKRPRPRKGR